MSIEAIKSIPDNIRVSVTRALIIAYSSAYERGHRDTVEGRFTGNGSPEIHDSNAFDWLAGAVKDGTFNRDIDI